MPPLLQDQNRYDCILAAAEVLFRTKGYHATSMSDVAEQCQIQKAALYYHFASKEALALAVMAKVQAYFDKVVFGFAYDKDMPRSERLAKLAQNLAAYYSADTGGCLFAGFAVEELADTPAFHAPIQHYFKSWTKACETLFAEVYDSESARTLAENFVADLQGALVMMRVTRQATYLQRLFLRLKETLAE
ncbi:TetR/AcrR family transcriptional regulator [Beijerinckia indica]|uniref:Transcriptional regulator, TetR family n=1 Tax=Beijerinckia indica subsp. indica (strain ATCC 9039 / DSM 1715 / NCIMB 8712) TaxID=395963 RepID=B2IHA2_BEII9|nr:TetR/AcrR family transcriptional regulator [Beijerinckia indica]ACB95887.1 transcriptional regulator, TetR family [Beijerinckia indica subsp. indica ATCC 9039]